MLMQKILEKFLRKIWCLFLEAQRENGATIKLVKFEVSHYSGGNRYNKPGMVRFVAGFCPLDR